MPACRGRATATERGAGEFPTARAVIHADIRREGLLLVGMKSTLLAAMGGTTLLLHAVAAAAAIKPNFVILFADVRPSAPD